MSKIACHTHTQKASMFFLTHIKVHDISIIITIIKIRIFTTFKLKINSYRVLLSLMIQLKKFPDILLKD